MRHDWLTGTVPRRITFKYQRPGQGTTTYDEWLVLDRPDVKVLLLESYEGKHVDVGGHRVLDPGAPIVWFVFPDAWHDVGRFHLADGTFTGWYTNFCKPVEFTNDLWRGTDLFLDCWLSADGEVMWLDEDEFDAAVRSRVIDAATKQRVRNERALIELQLGEGAWPPPIARDIDLAQARSLRSVA